MSGFYAHVCRTAEEYVRVDAFVKNLNGATRVHEGAARYGGLVLGRQKRDGDDQTHRWVGSDTTVEIDGKTVTLPYVIAWSVGG
ncbi:MAG: hypothetical protein ACOC05_09635 [Oceanicaulis sp.]